MTQQNYTSMTYIQRMCAKARPDFNMSTIGRVISFDYMGSCEFEWGVIPKTLKFLRTCDLKITNHVVTALGRDVKFWVIGSQKGIDRFKDKIQAHADGTARTKEWTSISDLFTKPNDRTTAWLDVTGTVNADAPSESAEPVFFTARKKLAAAVFLELYRAKTAEESKVVNEYPMFSHVYIPQCEHAGRISGINEDGSFTVKVFHQTYKVSGFDIWPVLKFPLAILNEAGMGYKEYQALKDISAEAERDFTNTWESVDKNIAGGVHHSEMIVMGSPTSEEKTKLV